MTSTEAGNPRQASGPLQRCLDWLRCRVWSPLGILVLWMAVSFPVLSDVFVSPPDSASYMSVARTMVISRNLDMIEEYGAFRFDTHLVYWTSRDRLSLDWPIGAGVVWAPAYAAAHVIALTAGTLGVESELFDTSGTNGIYRLVLSFWVLALVLLALRLGISMSRGMFGTGWSIAAALAVLMGTPVGFYLYQYALMSHGTSMAALGLFLWGWNRTRPANGGRSRLQWLMLGAAAGVMAMIRPQNGAFLVVFLIEWFLERRNPVVSPRAWWQGAAMSAGAAIVTFSPQMIVWRVLYGNALQLPKIEEMHWFAPKFMDTLFSDYHGLIPWSPLLVLVPVGLVAIWRRDRALGLALTAIILIQTYLNAANEIWWAGGSFGNRRFADLGVPFIVCIAGAFRVLGRIAAPLIALPMVAWNMALAALERPRILTLEHYVPFDALLWDQARLHFASGDWVGPIVGDFAGFGIGTRVLAAVVLLGLGIALILGSPPRRFDSAKARGAVVWLATGYFALVPLYFVFLAARTTEFTGPANAAFELPDRNTSLFTSYYEQGFFLARKGRLEEALNAYDRARDLRPEFPATLRYMAWLLNRLERHEEAREHAMAALDLSPEFATAMHELRIATRAMLMDPAITPDRRTELTEEMERRIRLASQASGPLFEPEHQEPAGEDELPQ